jgi:hypothetical protein
MNDIRLLDWTEWNIALNMFESNNADLTLTAIETLYIGFGDRNNTSEAGGIGTVYFDDIRLYKPTCVPWARTLGFAKLDMNNDCVIDFGDVKVMAGDWLESDVNLGQVINPTDSNLVGWWNFDEDGGAGSVVTDSSSNGHDGDIETIDVNVWWVDGHGWPNDVNYALDFVGGRVRVDDTEALRPMHQVSVSAWIKYSDEQTSGRVVAKGVDDKETYQLEVDNDDDLKFSVRDGNNPNLESFPQYGAESDKDAVERDEWVHVAGTYDGNNVKCYINGKLAGINEEDANDIPFLSQDSNDLAIGNKPGGEDDPFIGIIDDVRVYDRGLTAAEVAYLATDGTGILSLQSIANLIDGETLGERAVNFRDFAVLAVEWLEEDLYPD